MKGKIRRSWNYKSTPLNADPVAVLPKPDFLVLVPDMQGAYIYPGFLMNISAQLFYSVLKQSLDASFPRHSLHQGLPTPCNPSTSWKLWNSLIKERANENGLHYILRTQMMLTVSVPKRRKTCLRIFRLSNNLIKFFFACNCQHLETCVNSCYIAFM